VALGFVDLMELIEDLAGVDSPMTFCGNGVRSTRPLEVKAR